MRVREQVAVRVWQGEEVGKWGWSTKAILCRITIPARHKNTYMQLHCGRSRGNARPREM